MIAHYIIEGVMLAVIIRIGWVTLRDIFEEEDDIYHEPGKKVTINGKKICLPDQRSGASRE